MSGPSTEPRGAAPGTDVRKLSKWRRPLVVLAALAACGLGVALVTTWRLHRAATTVLPESNLDAAEAQPTELSTFPKPYARRQAGARSSTEPPPIELALAKPLPNEGVWQAVGSTVNGVPALRSTFFRPDATRPLVTVAVARFTPELTRFVVVPGVRDPGGDWRWHGGVPRAERENLLAAFDAGFRLREARGGLYVEGKVAVPLVVGAASLVIDQSGGADIVAWTADKLTPSVNAVRQNLEPIVMSGEISPDLRGTRMWRSGLGIMRDGALIYLAGHDLSMRGLADALKHVGAVRAMQLDIHAPCQSFNVFQPSSPPSPTLIATKLLTTMRSRANRYLEPDARDFVAAFLR